jgi:hypothetical protein
LRYAHNAPPALWDFYFDGRISEIIAAAFKRWPNRRDLIFLTVLGHAESPKFDFPR